VRPEGAGGRRGSWTSWLPTPERDSGGQAGIFAPFEQGRRVDGAGGAFGVAPVSGLAHRVKMVSMKGRIARYPYLHISGYTNVPTVDGTCLSTYLSAFHTPTFVVRRRAMNSAVPAG